MTIVKNFDAPLYDYINDKELKEPVMGLVDGTERIVDVRPVNGISIVVRALLQPFAGDESLAGEKKAEHFALAMKVRKSGDIEYTPEELATIRARVRKGFSAMVSGQIDEIIDRAA